MKRIVISLEYGAYPMWIYDGPCVEENDLIEELRDNKLIDDLLMEIQDKYDSLFIDDGIDFSFKGFANEAEKTMLRKQVNEAIAYIKEKVGDKYQIETRIDHEF